MKVEEELKKGSVLLYFGEKAEWNREVKQVFNMYFSFSWLRGTDVHYICTNAVFLKLE